MASGGSFRWVRARLRGRGAGAVERRHRVGVADLRFVSLHWMFVTDVAISPHFCDTGPHPGGRARAGKPATRLGTGVPGGRDAGMDVRRNDHIRKIEASLRPRCPRGEDPSPKGGSTRVRRNLFPCRSQGRADPSGPRGRLRRPDPGCATEPPGSATRRLTGCLHLRIRRLRVGVWWGRIRPEGAL